MCEVAAIFAHSDYFGPLEPGAVLPLIAALWALRLYVRRFASRKSLQETSLGTSQNQRMYVVRAFCGITVEGSLRDGLPYLSDIPLPPCISRAVMRNIQRLTAVVSFHQRNVS